MAQKKDFEVFLEGRKLPVCVLDEKWHKLFALKGKPDHITVLEDKLNEYLQRQGQLTTEMKDLKKLKGRLMSNIVENMDGTHAENEGKISSRKLD